MGFGIGEPRRSVELFHPKGDQEVRREKRGLIHKGRAKRLCQTEGPWSIVQVFGDDTSLPDEKKKAKIKNTGAITKQISSRLFRYLEGYHIPTHYIQQLSDSEMLVKRFNIIPFEVMTRNIASGNLSVSYGMKASLDFPHPILERCLKSSRLLRPLLNRSIMWSPWDLRLRRHSTSSIGWRV
jgi:phosphoribosylaminoimidazole-succinocarboxamide synthase